jgi:pimeloyl-ACP methyl ester carboxylesterase
MMKSARARRRHSRACRAWVGCRQEGSPAGAAAQEVEVGQSGEAGAEARESAAKGVQAGGSAFGTLGHVTTGRQRPRHLSAAARVREVPWASEPAHPVVGTAGPRIAFLPRPLRAGPQLDADREGGQRPLRHAGAGSARRPAGPRALTVVRVPSPSRRMPRNSPTPSARRPPGSGGPSSVTRSAARPRWSPPCSTPSSSSACASSTSLPSPMATCTGSPATSRACNECRWGSWPLAPTRTNGMRVRSSPTPVCARSSCRISAARATIGAGRRTSSSLPGMPPRAPPRSSRTGRLQRSPAARHTRGPVVWLRGGESEYITDADVETMRTYFPRVRQVTVKGAGHWVHADRPGVVVETITRLLRAPLSS